MTTPDEWDDPFRRTPGSGGGSIQRVPAPFNAPPPTGPRRSGPAPMPGSEAAAPWRGEAAVPLPDWNAQTKWKRERKVTWKRWGIGWLVGLACAILGGFPAAEVAYSGWYSGGLAGDPASAGGFLFGTVAGYLLFVAWWLDTAVSRMSPNAIILAHGLTGGGLGLYFIDSTAQSSEPTLPAYFLALFGAVTGALAALAASRVKGSFDPAKQGVPVEPWGPDRA